MNTKPTQLLVIDPQVEDYQQLAAGIQPGVQLLILEKDRDGIEQITAYLSSPPPSPSLGEGTGVRALALVRANPYTTLHIISHGSPGTLYLGNTTLELNNIDQYRPQLQKWGISHLYLYGCSVAAGDAGAEFLQKLHQITQANIAASNTLTGNAAKGGNWELEITTGAIATHIPISQEARASYQYVLPSTFSNSTSITINNFGAATDYPSTINVSGVTGNIASMTVSISGLSHTLPDEIDMFLYGPAGQKVMLMSDAGGSDDLNGVNLTFSDSASGALPDGPTITSGTYRPTDYETGDTFPSPAPAGPYSTTLSTLNGTDANGTWQLFIQDDVSADSGSVGSWSLTITPDPVPTVSLSSAAATTTNAPFSVTANFSESVNNFIASDISVTNGTVSGFSGSGSTYTFTVTPPAREPSPSTSPLGSQRCGKQHQHRRHRLNPHF
ncbi:DUF4347 domain-containing protein [[Phormidium] sp. ETS-05]|uniref:DUF4347 domain-containing protein n=1 Tax=[Phormidium] sp. ETS-05 TaxID=222819 RepID=UPI0018EEDF55|nr:DUF4347 domain-containing protein [[Phormidium] sp. ETS-05]